jgi:hypothetical protein
VELFGEGGFWYAGNARADLDVWPKSGGMIVVQPHACLTNERLQAVGVEIVAKFA